MRTALDVHRELLARDVPHEVVRLRRRVSSADELPGVLGLRGGCVAVRLYQVTRRSPSRGWAAVLVPAGEVPDPAALLTALDAESVRPATATEANTVTGFANGLVSPVCLPAEVEVLADAALGSTDVVYAATGEPSLALGIRVLDLLVTVDARAATLTSAPAVPEPRFADIIDLDLAVDARAADTRPGGRLAPRVAARRRDG